MSQNAKRYLVMMLMHMIASGLSNIFVNVFLWKTNHSFTVLAMYSFAYSVAVLVSFPFGAWYARCRTAMSSTRLGILFYVLTFGLVLWLNTRAADYALEIGACLGLGVSFFVIGQHMQTLDSTENGNRDKFLYIGNFLNGFAGLLAPALGGFIIHRYAGMAGYYIVFSLSLTWFVIEYLYSLRIHGVTVSRQSHFREVWKNPTREWRGMYWVNLVASVVDGTYSTFLVTIMAYTILENEFTLGGYNTVVSLLAMLSSLYLAKKSSPSLRVRLFTLGACLLSAVSILISIRPSVSFLWVYGVVSAIAMNLLSTTLDSWSYASIEHDAAFQERKMDYIVIREVPLAIGRITGIGLFLVLQSYFGSNILSISFALFGSLYVVLIPMLFRIWRTPRVSGTTDVPLAR